MFRKRKFWENVGESLGKGEIFDKTLRELLGRRVDEEFYEREEELKETEKMIRCYEEAIGMEIALKKAINVALQNDANQISAKVLMKEKWPDTIWKKWQLYCSVNGILYEFDEQEKSIFLYVDEDVVGCCGDDYDDIDQYGNPIINGIVYDEECPQNCNR